MYAIFDDEDEVKITVAILPVLTRLYQHSLPQNCSTSTYQYDTQPNHITTTMESTQQLMVELFEKLLLSLLVVFDIFVPRFEDILVTQHFCSSISSRCQ